MVTKVQSRSTGFPGELVPIGAIVSYVGSTPPSAGTIAASCTFTIGDTEFDDVNNGTLTLISTDGTSKTYVVKNDYGASSALEFNAGANTNACAANLKAVIESSGGHNGKLVVAQVDGQLTITQATTGQTGNSLITSASNFDNICDVNPPARFTSGRSDGWLYCDGEAVSRTVYATLFAQIGTTYGTGDGSTTFNLPDLRGRYLVGRDGMGVTAAAGRVTSGSHGVDAATLGAVGGALVSSSESLSQSIVVNWIIRASSSDS